MGIEEIRETMDSCKHCYMCRHACPTFLATKLDSHTPRGYALLLSEIDHGSQSWTPTVIDRFYQCSLCGLCKEDCAYHWAEDEVVRNAREEIVNHHIAPTRVAAIAQRIITSGSPYENQRSTIEAASADIEKKDAKILYFAGCSTRQNHLEIISAVDKVLGSLKIDWTILKEEGCCGTPLWELGYVEEAKRVAKETAERISSLKPTILMSGCPHCIRAFSELYPSWGIAFPASVKIMHTSQYFDLMLSQGKLKLRKNTLSRAIYHDPCQLGRKLGEYDAPRRLIKFVTGENPVELFHSRQAAECCGAGSVMFLTDGKISKKVAASRMVSISESVSELLVTACQNCKRALGEVQSSKSSNTQVLDIVEIISRSI